ncbi:MAG: bacterial Ig-like domain-containing protein [Acutalibacteraceae bacterium]
MGIVIGAILLVSAAPVTMSEGDEEEMVPAFYTPNVQNWLYFGWENHDHKSSSTMGGALFAGGANPYKGVRRSGGGKRTPPDGPTPNQAVFDEKPLPIRYTVTVDGVEYTPDETSPNRRFNTRWYQADGYMNSPVSEWEAGETGITVEIRHVTNEVTFRRNGQDTLASVVFTKVTLHNDGGADRSVVLNVSALSDLEVPMNAVPFKESKDNSQYIWPQSADDYALYRVNVPAGGSDHVDFAATVWNYPDPATMKAMGSFDEQYAAVKAHYDGILADMTLPVSLPDQDIANSYINSMIVMWESMVRATVDGQADYQIRGSAATQAKAVNNPSQYMHGYDVYFPHDVPNMVEQFIRDGRLELAMRIMDSPNYQTLYLPEHHGGNLDAVPKYILPYATLWQAMTDAQRESYFTAAVREKIRTVSREIVRYIEPETGLIQKSESLDNNPYDYLVVDDFTALHGLTAYRYLCREWGDTDEEAWATQQMTALNGALNAALDDFMRRHDVDWYMCAMNDDSGFWKRHENGSVTYDGNWISSTLMMSTFPWDAMLRGLELGGTWKDYLESTMDNAVALKNARGDIPEGSWGAWWGHEYGTVYNVGQGIALLGTEGYRTAGVKAYEWLMDNQGAPYQWTESFDRGQNASDWTRAAIDYETWGLGFLRQGLLESTASVKTDGTVIVGRGIPDEWLMGDAPVSWQNIAINNGRRFDTLTLSSPDESTVCLQLSGDDAWGDIVLDLPVMKGNIASASTGVVDNAAGTVTVPGNTKQLTVTLIRPMERPVVAVTTPENLKAKTENQDINLTWDKVEGARRYTVRITADGESLGEQTVSENAFLLRDAVPGLSYSFAVNAVGEEGVSDFTNDVSASVAMPTDPSPNTGALTVEQAVIPAGSNQDLTELGNLDWIKTGYGTRGQNDVVERKNRNTAYIHRFYFPAKSQNDILYTDPNDYPYTYSWGDGTAVVNQPAAKLPSLSMGAYFGEADLAQEQTVWMVTAPCTAGQENTLLVDFGAWQVKGHIDVYMSDNSVPVQTIPFEVGNPVVFSRLTIQYQAPQGSTGQVVVAATIESKTHYAGNMPLAAAALQGEAVTLTGLTVSEPSKTLYTVGEPFEHSGMTVTAHYRGADDRAVNDFILSGIDFSTPGEKTVTVSYEEDGVQVSADFSVMVVLPGDLDFDGDIDAADALMALQAATGKILLTPAEQLAAQVDGSPNVTASDALLILQRATGKIIEF